MFEFGFLILEFIFVIIKLFRNNVLRKLLLNFFRYEIYLSYRIILVCLRLEFCLKIELGLGM